MTHADTLTYTGDDNDLKLPPAWIGGMTNDLYPGSRANPSGSGNTIIIDYDPADPNMANPDNVSGGLSQTEASYNTVILRNGTITGDVFGGEVRSTGTGNTTANYNTVTINGGTVNGNVTGGYAVSGGTGNTTANYNTVTIGANASLANSTQLWGGSGSGGGTRNLFTGNTLNIAGQHKVGAIVNFERLNFTLSNTMHHGDTLITAGIVSLDNSGANRPSTIDRVDIAVGGTPLAVGSTVTLLDATNWNNSSIANTTASGMKGMSLLYEWEIDTTGINPGNPSTLKATVKSFGLNPQTHALLSGRSAQTALLTQGADLVAGRGMAAMKASAAAGHRSFMAVQGGSSRYKTGSGIDMDSFSFMAGAAWGTKVRPDLSASLGAFVEMGTGSYNSSNSFTGMASVRGSGDTDFIGGGILGSLEWDSGLYVDASFRAGRVKSDLSTSVVNYGQNAAYDETASLYLGAHAGLGYRLALSKADSLDVFTRYLWGYTDSDSVKVLGDTYHFDSSNSHRWRTGVKAGHAFGELTPYAGIAYEYEFDGKAGGSVLGYRLKETDMGGSTFIGEVGLSWVPKDEPNMSLDLALEGFAGQRDGFMGNVRFNYRF